MNKILLVSLLIIIIAGCAAPKSREHRAILAWQQEGTHVYQQNESVHHYVRCEAGLKYIGVYHPNKKWEMEEERIIAHRVKKDESVSTIAEQYYGSPKEYERILNANPHLIDADVIYIDSVIYVPVHINEQMKGKYYETGPIDICTGEKE